VPEKKTEPTHVTAESLFEDLGFSAEEAAVLRVKVELHSEIMKAVKKRKLSPRQLEKVLNVPQPRVSELINGKISRMTADLLAKYLHRLGREVRVRTLAAQRR
jgi:predicted XRE-type DNA-binding protein